MMYNGKNVTVSQMHQIRAQDRDDPVIRSRYDRVTIKAGDTSILVLHRLGDIPDMIEVTPLDEYGIDWYASALTSTTFTLNIHVAQGTDAVFLVRAERQIIGGE